MLSTNICLPSPTHKISYRIEDGGSNEDRVLVYRRTRSTLLAVCDGAGNGGKGGRAADCAIAHLLAAAQGGFVDWRRELAELDQLLYREGQGGETTCVVIELGDRGEIRGASVGDSGAVMLPASRAPQTLTADQDRMRLGSGRCTPVGVRAQLMGQLLIATDGLLKYLPWSELTRTAARGVDALINSVRLRDSGAWPDDVAAILVE